MTHPGILSPFRTALVGYNRADRLETIRRSPSVDIISREDFERTGDKWREDADAISQWLLQVVHCQNHHERYKMGEYLCSIPSQRTLPHPSRANPCCLCRLRRHWILDCPNYCCLTCCIAQLGHMAHECQSYFINRHGGMPPTPGDRDSHDEIIYNEENLEAL